MLWAVLLQSPRAQWLRGTVVEGNGQPRDTGADSFEQDIVQRGTAGKYTSVRTGYQLVDAPLPFQVA